MNEDYFTFPPLNPRSDTSIASPSSSDDGASASGWSMPIEHVSNRPVGFGPMRLGSARPACRDGLRQAFANAMGLDDLSPLTGKPMPLEDLSCETATAAPAFDRRLLVGGAVKRNGRRLLAWALPCLACSHKNSRIESCLHAVQAEATQTGPVTVAERLQRFAALREACGSSHTRRFIVVPFVGYGRAENKQGQPCCIETFSFSLRVHTNKRCRAGTDELYEEVLPCASLQCIFDFNRDVAAAGFDVRHGLMLQAQVLKQKMLSEICLSRRTLDTNALIALDNQLNAVNQFGHLAYAPTAALMQQLYVLAAMLKNQQIWTHIEWTSQPSTSGGAEGFRFDATMQIPTEPLPWLTKARAASPSHVTRPLFTASLRAAECGELPSILTSTIAIMTLLARCPDDIFEESRLFLDHFDPPLTDTVRRAVLQRVYADCCAATFPH